MLDNELLLAKEICKRAGNYLQSQKTNTVESTNGKDIKIRADREAEEIIVYEIMKNSPWPIIAEERGLYGNLATKVPVWIVDPIDGTYNYYKGVNFCCISIGLWMDDNPLMGVIYDFNRDEMFSGVVGGTAWCNEEEIHVSPITNASEASLATGFPVFRDYDDTSLDLFVNQVKIFKKIRIFGSAALSLAYLSCGRIEAYYEEDIMLWDVAAGIAIAKAAGGHVLVEKGKNIWGRTIHAFSCQTMEIELRELVFRNRESRTGIR